MNNEILLRSLGFIYIEQRDLWIHHTLRKGFSYEAIRDCDGAWLQRALAEQTDKGEFWFYHKVLPADVHRAAANCFKILSEIGLPTLQPLIRLATLTAPYHPPIS